jgi:hypothetical protein
MRRLKPLEDEDANPRKVLADLSRDEEMPQDALRRSSPSLNASVFSGTEKNVSVMEAYTVLP